MLRARSILIEVVFPRLLCGYGEIVRIRFLQYGMRLRFV